MPYKLAALIAFTLALVFAQTPTAQAQQALDLSLPAEPASPSSKPADPPGTYYGDTSGEPAKNYRPGQDFRAPEDDGTAKVWGSFTTSVGHAKGLGTYWGNSANINVAKSFGENNQGRVIFSADVGSFDGPGLRRRDDCDSSVDTTCRPYWPSP